MWCSPIWWTCEFGLEILEYNGETEYLILQLAVNLFSVECDWIFFFLLKRSTWYYGYAIKQYNKAYKPQETNSPTQQTNSLNKTTSTTQNWKNNQQRKEKSQHRPVQDYTPPRLKQLINQAPNAELKNLQNKDYAQDKRQIKIELDQTKPLFCPKTLPTSSCIGKVKVGSKQSVCSQKCGWFEQQYKDGSKQPVYSGEILPLDYVVIKFSRNLMAENAAKHGYVKIS